MDPAGAGPVPGTVPVPPQPELLALAAAVPENIKFGTAGWSTDGWAGDVYHRVYRGAQPAARLEEYVRYPLFRMVGVNSAFYESPSETILDAYARVLPQGYACNAKVWDRITARRFIRDRRWGSDAGQLNPDFLNARLFLDKVLKPYTRVFRRQAISFVFQFQAMRGPKLEHEGDRLAPEHARVRLQHLVEEEPGVQEVRIELTGVAAPAPVADEAPRRDPVPYLGVARVALRQHPRIGVENRLRRGFVERAVDAHHPEQRIADVFFESRRGLGAAVHSMIHVTRPAVGGPAGRAKLDVLRDRRRERQELRLRRHWDGAGDGSCASRVHCHRYARPGAAV